MNRKLKQILLILTIILISYFGIGSLLLYTETIQRLPIFPGWTIKHGATDEDNSTISSDGPMIILEDDKVINYQIIPKDTLFIAQKVEISKKDTLTCFIDETKDQFQFQLKDSLQIEPTNYILPNKMLVISDIEGNFKGFKSILLGNKIIDKTFNWTFGNNHLVLVGDFFDRGLNVTECLWLIYKLEKEANKQGGKVHFILGNHEVMNLHGNLKYVRDKYKKNSSILKLDYKNWYSNNSELGKWLRTKNGIEKIGDYLFVHAGIGRDFPKKFTLSEINNQIRKSIDKNFKSKEESRNDLFTGNQSPIWYRGIAEEDERQDDIERILAHYKATKMIIGHTIFDDIQYLYNGRVIAIDLDHKANSEKGSMYALWYENKKFEITDQYGIKQQLQ